MLTMRNQFRFVAQVFDHDCMFFVVNLFVKNAVGIGSPVLSAHFSFQSHKCNDLDSGNSLLYNHGIAFYMGMVVNLILAADS